MNLGDLIRGVLSLLELRTRRDWLVLKLKQEPVSDAALILDALCQSAEGGHPEAREVMSAWVAGLVTLEHDPWIQQLQRQSFEQHLLSLRRLLRNYASASSSPEPKPLVPDYGAGRELTLGERRALARRPQRSAMDKLLRDPHPLVLQVLLENPRLTESDVLRLASARPLRPTVVTELARQPHWLLRPRVRMALLHNPGTQAAVALPLLGLCKRDELQQILENTTLHTVLRASAAELLERRPPLREVPDLTPQ